MPSIQELINRGDATEGSLLIPKTIYKKIVEAADKKRISRDLVAIYNGPADIPGSSIDIDTETADSMSVRRIGEGAAVPLDSVGFASFNMKPDKYGVRPAITKEMAEDSKWKLIEYNIKAAGKKMGENETSLIITDALDGAGNTVSGSGAITIANITRAIQYLEDNDYDATDILVGPEVMNDIRNIDTLTEADKTGGKNDPTQSGIKVIFDAKLHRISGNLITSAYAYVIDRAEAITLAEKRPLTMEKYNDAIHDMSGIVITQRIKARYLRSNAIAKITT